MKFKITATATEVRTGNDHEITGTVNADSAKAARSLTIQATAAHGYQIHGVPEVEEQS